MVKYKLVKTLFYEGEECAIEGQFIMAMRLFGQAEKLLLKYLIQQNPIFQCIFQISFRKGNLTKFKGGHLLL